MDAVAPILLSILNPDSVTTAGENFYPLILHERRGVLQARIVATYYPERKPQHALFLNAAPMNALLIWVFLAWDLPRLLQMVFDSFENAILAILRQAGH